MRKVACRLPSPRWPKFTTGSWWRSPRSRVKSTSSAMRSRGTTTSSLTLPIITLATAALTALRAAQSRCASAGSAATATVVAPASDAVSRTEPAVAATSPLSPSSSTMTSAAASPPRVPPPACRMALSAPASRNSIAAGTMPSPAMPATAAAALCISEKVAASVARDVGAGMRRRSTSVTTARVPSDPLINASRSRDEESPLSPRRRIDPSPRTAVSPST